MKHLYITPSIEMIKAEGMIILSGSDQHEASIGNDGTPNWKDEPNGGEISNVGDVTGDDGPNSTAKGDNMWDNW